MAKTLDRQPGELQPLWQHSTGLLLALADAAWAAAWFRLGAYPLHPEAGMAAILLALSATAGLAYLSAAAMDRLRILSGVQRLVWAALFAGGLAVQAAALDLNLGEVLGRILRLELVGLFLLGLNLLLWQRAITLARDWFGPIAAWSRLRAGAVLLFVYLFVAGRLRPQALSLGPLFAFLVLALLAMAAARISFINQYHGGQRNPFGRGWAALTGAVTLATAGLALALSSLLTGQLSGLLAQTGAGLGAVLRAVLYVIALPFFLLLYLLEPLIARLREQAPPPAELAETPGPQIFPGGPGDPLAEIIGPAGGGGGLPEWLGPALFWGAVLLVVLWVFGRRGRRPGRRQSRQVETEFSQAEGGLFNRWRRGVQQAAGGLSPLAPRQRQRAAARIRQIYAALMELSARLEKPRSRSQTPLEFLPVLDGLFPGQGEEVRLITQAYLKVRYGELPETRAEVDAVERAWQRISTRPKSA